jgi:hypothetical protein
VSSVVPLRAIRITGSDSDEPGDTFPVLIRVNNISVTCREAVG